MSALAHALIAELDGASLDALADALAPRIAARLASDPQKRATDWLRGAEKIAAYIGAPRSRMYSLMSAGRIPIHKDGSALVARRSDLDSWIRSGGGRRP